MEGLTLALVPLLLIAGTTGDTVRFGVILEDQNPSEPYSYGHVGPAVELAVQRINREGWLGPHRLMAQYQKITKMSQYTALTVAMGMYENDSGNLDFFLGPTSEYLAQTVIRLAAFWKVPVMTCSIVWRLGVKGDPRDDGNYETVVRTVPTSGDLGKLVLRLYQEYDWTRGFQLYHKGNDDDSCYFLQSGIWSEWHIVNEERELEPLTHESIAEFSQDEFNLTDPAGRREMDKRFADELERVKAVSRVIITCASAPYVWRLMKVAREMGMTNGDYVFLIVDVFDHAYLQPDTWIGSEDNQQERRDILDAFRAAFVITVPRPDTPAFREFSEQVREIGKQNFGFDSGETLANPFVESYFNDVLLYATALNGTPGYNYTNGTEMALKMRNVSFIGKEYGIS
ncbi:PREDICTED: atrial natriuretic peptide receptor 1-like [Branchiostoma belcheri]|uniref:Atrial natriuretic peptide receptor 1-like n=1 Tax=Branchiostoma belcheri TaxID=7741 RepID=A0A6P4Y021_BRABE|nr:PREDICTED: atrial natriuretic peptide receptor 1-like [Branchiostoma belcheri]